MASSSRSDIEKPDPDEGQHDVHYNSRIGNPLTRIVPRVSIVKVSSRIPHLFQVASHQLFELVASFLPGTALIRRSVLTFCGTIKQTVTSQVPGILDK